MQRYVEQLVEDLRAIAKNPPHLLENGGGSFPDSPEKDDLAEIEELYGGEEHPLSGIVGLPKSALPDHRRLSDKQVIWLTSELIETLHAWNFQPDFPDNVPVRLQYDALRNHWDDKLVYMRFGTVVMQLCDANRLHCPFPGYCQICDETEKEMEPVDYDYDFDFVADDLLPDTETLMNHPEFSNLKSKQETLHEGKTKIPGIYNYCDRWCERCNFTERCSVFASEKEFEKIAEAPEGQQEKLIAEMEERIFGFDENDEFEDFDEDEMDDFPYINQEIDEEEYEKEQNDLFSPRKQAERHPLVIKVREYSDLSNEWLTLQDANTKNNIQKLLANGTADIIFGALDVIGWFHFFLFTKIERAMNGHYEMEENEFAEGDMNGSAKVALLGIDESIEAFTMLQLHLRSEKSAIKNFRKLLEEIRTEAEQIFPDARSFIRPGLDEVE